MAHRSGEALVEELAAAMAGDRGGTPAHGRLWPVEMAKPSENDAQG